MGLSFLSTIHKGVIMTTKLNRPTALTIGAIALIFGALGPWISFLGVISAGPMNFTEVAVAIFTGIGLVIASAVSGLYMRIVSIFVGLVVLSQVAYVWFHLSEAGVNDLVQPGWGLFLSTLAGLYLISSTWVARKPDVVTA